MDRADRLGQPIGAVRRLVAQPNAAIAAVLFILLLARSAPAAAEEIVQPASRDVTPANMTPAPKGAGPLVREPTDPAQPTPARWRRFVLPATLDAGTFAVKGETIAVAGVARLKHDASCKAADGTVWPCGRTALIAFRLFLAGRPIECFFPAVAGATTIIAPCRIGQTDLGLWLLSEGWGKPDGYATDDYRKAAAAAEKDRRGLWRTASAGASPQ